MAKSTTHGTNQLPPVERISADAIAALEPFGVELTPIEPVGFAVRGLDLTGGERPHPKVVEVLEREMARRGFLVFKNEEQLSPDDFLRVSCWWGGKALHSTHGIHPATPGHSPHLFRLSNDPRHGIPGVGPQWHNDGSFEARTFSHAGYHIIRPAEKGGGTCFAHQGAAFDALPAERQEFWRRLASVNSASGVVHPAVHEHPLTGRSSLWLHLGMTGAVIEKRADGDGLRALDADELTRLCHEYNDVLNAGFENGYAIEYEYEPHDCLFIDNLAVAHRASPKAHRPVEEQGLRIMERSTVRGLRDFAAGFGLPPKYAIDGPNPFGSGVWQAGGIGFRWDDAIPMRN